MSNRIFFKVAALTVLTLGVAAWGAVCPAILVINWQRCRREGLILITGNGHADLQSG